jgi:uncharacterized tellurite resistance protein B-like protein
MIKSLKEFLSSRLPVSGSETGQPEKTVELSAAVLMLEISLADSDLAEEERRLIESAIQRHFRLDAEETKALMELAQQEVDHAVSLYEFTRLINDTLAPGEKIRIIELLWRVANADAVIDKYEEYFIRKIADLLYVSHKDYIKAKHRAVENGAG